jgi:pimeloyl-ACP methyl ester carboxylesterase
MHLRECGGATVAFRLHGHELPPHLNRLRGYEETRRNYQFWFYSYPSGYPYPYSAAIQRRELDAIEKRFPLRKPMVVIGHSVGGCISRLLITDTGDKLWMKLFKKPPEQVPLSPESRKLFTEALIFPHRPEIGRVIFISAPLRGSELASNWLGRIGSSLVKSPITLLKAGRDAIKITTFRSGELRLKRIPNSVDTLAPTNRFVLAINTIPITPGIPYHTIMGDRGKGDAPNSSDGVVPYWSSHMDGAKSELIVSSGHAAHQNPKAIEEVRRILTLNMASLTDIEGLTKGALLEEDQMAMTPDMDTARIERTMRVVEYEDDKPKVKRFLEQRLEDPEAEPDVPTDWDLSFDEYLEEHKNSKLLFCWYSRSVGIVFSPSDHNGIWAGRLEGVKGKGTLPGYVLKVVERIAKEKGLA